MKKLITIVEDDDATRQLAESFLVKEGFQVKLFSSSIKALEFLEDNKPDLVILDFQMEDLNGLDFLIRLENQKNFKVYFEVPVIVLTALFDKQNIMEELLKRGVSAYLFKPFGRSELINIIENILITSNIKKQTSQVSHRMNKLHDLKKDPYFQLPFSVLYLDQYLIIKNANPKAMQEFKYILEKQEEEPLPTLFERYSVNATRELQKACFHNNLCPYSFLDFIYTPQGLKKAHLTIIEIDDAEEEYKYILIVDFISHNIEIPDEIFEMLSWLEIFPIGIIIVDKKNNILHNNLFSKQKLLLNEEISSTNKLNFNRAFKDSVQHVFKTKNPILLQNEKVLENIKKSFDIVVIPLKSKKEKNLILFSDYKKYDKHLINSDEATNNDPNRNDKNISFPLKLLKQFVHDARTPLNTIQGFSKLLVLEKDLNLTDQAKEDLSAIHRNGILVSNMIDKLVDFARVKNNDIDFNKKRIDINNILEKVLNHMKLNIERAETIIDFKKGEVPEIMGDETAINKSIFYIFENAYLFNFKKENKKIKIETGIKDSKYIFLTIEDNGIGMSNQEIKKIFSPLYVGNAVKERKVKGLGAGLFIANKLIEKLDGQISVESKKDVGTKVEINFPIL